MRDTDIIEKYWNRDEEAIMATIQKYEGFCYGIALNILTNKQDAEECVNDTWMKAWNSIPPVRPTNFRNWLGRVVRNISYNRWKMAKAKKRDADNTNICSIEQILEELGECVPALNTVENELDGQELTDFLNEWLRAQPAEDRILMMRRYWNGEQVKMLAEEFGKSPTYIAKRLYLLRQKLKNALEKEGYSL